MKRIKSSIKDSLLYSRSLQILFRVLDILWTNRNSTSRDACCTTEKGRDRILVVQQLVSGVCISRLVRCVKPNERTDESAGSLVDLDQ